MPERRVASHEIEVELPVDDMMDWGLLGYHVGEMVEEDIPLLAGIRHTPSLIKLKHFGAAAASSGGVEMYHIPGTTPEAPTREAALGGKVDVPTPRGTISLRVPPNSSSGKKLRVKGHGVASKNGQAGDLYAILEIVLPGELDPDSVELVKKLDEHIQSANPQQPRRDLRW